MPTTIQENAHIPQPTPTTPLLLTTKTCPACRVTTQWLDKKGISYQKAYADENIRVAERYHIRSVPVMVTITPGGEEKMLFGFYEIRDHYS